MTKRNTTGVPCPNDEVDDVLLYNSKLLSRNENTGQVECFDVYDGAVKTFTKIESYYEAAKNGSDKILFFVTVVPDWFSEHAVSTLLRYIHQGLSKGNSTFELDSSNVEDLYDAATYLQCHQAVEDCVQFWLERVTIESCVDMLLDVGLRRSISQVSDKAIDIFRRYFSSVVPGNKRYLELPFEMMQKCLVDDLLDAPNEKLVFETVVNWIEHDRGQRLGSAKSLLRCVRFMFCGVDYIRNVITHHALLTESSCHALAGLISINIRRLEAQPTNFMNSREYMVRPRVSRAAVFAIGGWSNGQASALVEVYDKRAHRWFPISNDNDVQPRAYHGLVPIGSKIFMIGGFDGTNCFNDVRCYDSATHKWTEKAPMHKERCYVSVACLEEQFVYALGGYDGTSRTNTAERYNVKRNIWTMLPPMNAVRSDASATALNGKIYIVGGFTGDGVLPSVEFYDPQTNLWTAVRSMMSPRSGVRCINHLGRLIVLGGYNGRDRLNTVERYDERRDRWERLPDMPTVRSNFGIVSFEGVVLAIGGFNGQTTISQVDALDTKENTWKTIQGMTINRSALGACVCETADPKYYSMLSRDSSTFTVAVNAPLTLEGRIS